MGHSKYFTDEELAALAPQLQPQPQQTSKYISDEELMALAPRIQEELMAMQPAPGAPQVVPVNKSRKIATVNDLPATPGQARSRRSRWARRSPRRLYGLRRRTHGRRQGNGGVSVPRGGSRGCRWPGAR